jgi:hypothetical protein
MPFATSKVGYWSFFAQKNFLIKVGIVFCKNNGLVWIISNWKVSNEIKGKNEQKASLG